MKQNEERAKIETFNCELGKNHCVTVTSDCEDQSVVDGHCIFYKPIFVEVLNEK